MGAGQIFIGFLMLGIMLIILFGWIYLLISGIVRVKREKGGKGRLIGGAVWGILSVLVLIYYINLFRGMSGQFEAEDFNPQEYTGTLGEISIPYKGESFLGLYDTVEGKTIRFTSPDGTFRVPPGDYSVSSWTGTVKRTGEDKSEWTVSASHYSFDRKGKVFTVGENSQVELNDTFFKCFETAPELQITTKPDSNKKGNTGIGLDIVACGENLDYMRNGKPLPASVEIRKEDGGIIHQSTAGMDKFVFG